MVEKHRNRRQPMDKPPGVPMLGPGVSLMHMTRSACTGMLRHPPLFAILSLAVVSGLGRAHGSPAHRPAPAHKGGPAPKAAPAAHVVRPTPDPSPGARTQAERTHVLEAQWTEVVVKARKEGAEVLAAVKLVQPKIRIFHAAPPPEDPADKKVKDKPPKGAPPDPSEAIDLAETLRKITPLDVDHIDILDGQVAFVDTSRKERPEIWMHELQLSVENLTTRVHLTEGRPVLLTASAVLAHSGTLSMFVTADPFEKGLTFSGRVAVVGLETSELYRFIEPVTNLQAPEGTIDIFIEFDCRNGELTGGIKPVLKNLKIRPDDSKLFTVLKAWVADLAIKMFSDRVRDRNAIATVIPIKGTLTGPDIQLWPTIFGVMRNAFVEGLSSGFAFLPPATAEKKEGVVTQGVKALSGSGPAPPKAQPSAHGDHAPAPPPGATTSPSESHSTSPPAAP
jgi:Domain of Unknown Function (DUF748)